MGGGEQVVQINGIDLCYEVLGEQGDRTVLLIMGLGGPLTWWDDEFCTALVARGFQVIRFDNRDVGRSGSADGRVNVVRSYLRRAPKPPYTLADMAADAAGLLAHLGLGRVDVVGVSMGGMIAQILALRHPELVRSLTSIMSSTGARRVGWTHPRVVVRQLGRLPTDEAGYVARNLAGFSRIGSARYLADNTERQRLRAAATFARGLNPEGTVRQLGAILHAPDRTAELAGIKVPTVVIHGTADPLVHVSGGLATARAIPDAELILVPGMGHDMPPQLWGILLDGIERASRRADTTTGTGHSADVGSSPLQG
ncbi:MAG: alpha/beta fold hydrolase [Sporichthyaceae bacterium]